MAKATKPRSVRQHIAELLLTNRRHRRLLGIFVVAALLTSLVVANLLSQSGIAMTHEETILTCPVPGGEHTHASECYDEGGNLICTLEEHVHGPGCYTTITVKDEEPEAEVVETISDPEPAAEPETEPAPAESQPAEVEPQATEEPRPAQTLSDELLYDDDSLFIRVQVDAPEGALPAGSSLRIDYVEPTDVHDKAEAELAKKTDEKLADLQGVRLTFLDANGAEVTAAQQLTVHVTSELARDHGTPHLLLINKDNDAKAIDILDKTALEARNLTPADDELIADAKPQDLSLLVLATTASAEEPAATAEDPAAQASQPAEPADATPNLVTITLGEHTLTLTHETSALAVTATITDSQPIPEGARLEVTPLTPASPAYDAYMDALNRDVEGTIYTSANALLYDISVMVGSEEFEPTDGKVDITLDFKRNQLSENLGIDVQDNSAIQVIHLPVVAPAAEAPAAETPAVPNPDDIAVEYVPDTTVDATATTEAVSFSLNSLSVITVTTANTDVNVTASLLGTDMQTLGYNLYAYLLASNDNNAYGAKINFVNGNATATIPNVPANTYRLYLVYARDNRELQERWNYNNVLESNTNNWVDTDGGYIFGYSARMPEDKTITPSDNSISFALEIPNVQSSISMKTIMDRAFFYGITAENVKFNTQAFTNFATKSIDIANSNTTTVFSSRADNVEVVPNILAEVNHNGQPLATSDKPANYYVTEDDKDKVSSAHEEETIVRNHNEIADRVEIMLYNTLRQCDTLAASSMATLPSTTQVDVSGYADEATIILNADAINGERNGFTIIKRPGQTVVFNINGQTAAPPDNIKVKLVNKTGQQVDIYGEPSSKIYNAGTEMRDAAAAEGNVWSRIVWNFPNATRVNANNCVGGIFLVPKGDFIMNDKGGGWIVARGTVEVPNGWYGFPGDDEPFKQKIIRKTFVGITVDEIDPNYVLRLYTDINDSSAQGTTHGELITTLVLKPDSESLVHDHTGVNDQTGYRTMGTDEEGNVVVEWQTPPLSVGNEHALTEENSTSVGDPALPVELIEFVGPYSAWSEASQRYEWEARESQYANEAEFEGVFNVSSHNEDYRQYVYVTNHYHVDKTPRTLTLSKAVVDPEGIEPEDQSYAFTVVLVGEDGTALAGQVSYQLNDGEVQTADLTDGVLTLQLKRDDTVKLLELPYGTSYTINETNVPAKCSVAFSGDTSSTTEATGKLIKDRSVTATNTFSDDPGVPVTAHKDLVGGTLRAGQFTYHLIDGNGQLVKEAVNDANGNISFGTLVFDTDGDYDYYLLEVADASQQDIIFDPAEYIVHLHVEDGRVRQVSYTGEDGHTYTTPMFVNRQIPAETDTLTARKVFIDNATEKAIELEGGEFTFTATSKVTGEGEPIVYTGTNDADGMVTFRDAAGNVVNLDDLTQPETFVIAEVEGSYTGVVPAGHTLSYDTSAHEATAEVDQRTVWRNPWTTETVDSNTTTLTLTFTPSDTSGRTYYIGGPFGVQYSEIRSDGTVSFTISVNKNALQRDNAYHSYSVEYGKGDNYYWDGGHQRLGEVSVMVKAGDWGQEPVEVSNVYLDGNQLSPTSETVKTVTLKYADGHYPVFVNTLDADEPETTNFPFTKVWVDNVTYANPQAWGIGTEITVNLSGEFVADGQTAASETSSYTFKIKGVADELGQLAFEFTQPSGEGAPQIEVASVSGGTNHYAFVIKGLADRDTVGGAKGRWTYHLTEEPVDGFVVSYGAWDSDEGKAVPNPVIAEQGIGTDGYLINAMIMVELPSAGGPGTVVYAVAGTMMIIAGALLFVARRRNLI